MSSKPIEIQVRYFRAEGELVVAPVTYESAEQLQRYLHRYNKVHSITVCKNNKKYSVIGYYNILEWIKKAKKGDDK